MFAYGWQRSPDAIPVETIRVERGAIASFVSVTGTVVSPGEITVLSPVSAEIADVFVAEGASVHKGTLLARLDSAEERVKLERLRATLSLAASNRSDAERHLKQLQRLLEVGGESQRSVDEAALRLATAEKDVKVAASDVEAQQLHLARYAITAPLTGVMTSRFARHGQRIMGGEPMFKLAPAEDRLIEARIDASDGNAAHIGNLANVSAPRYGTHEWQEIVTWAAPSTTREGGTNTVTVRLSLSKTAPLLMLGEQVDIKIRTAYKSDATKLPASAIITRKGQSLVALEQDGRIHMQEITTGIEDVSEVEIVSGIQENDLIVLSNGLLLKEGDKVFSTGAARP